MIFNIYPGIHKKNITDLCIDTLYSMYLREYEQPYTYHHNWVTIPFNTMLGFAPTNFLEKSFHDCGSEQHKNAQKWYVFHSSS